MIKATLLAAFVAVACTPAWAQDGAPVQLVIDTTHPGVLIDKDIQGQFAEHLGLGIYGGLWVGPKSKIPNVHGWRKDVVGALRKLHVPLVRWPGGCFADRYHWRDGVGAAAKRPVRVNMWGGVPETNAVGTHEFFDLVDQIGARAYVNGNMGSGTVQEMSDWMEYLTADSQSTLAKERRANGRAKPFPVAYFGVGNESWGCGGHMKPEQYAANYEQYANFLAPDQQRRPKFVASGGNDDDTSWTEAISARVKGNVDEITFHYYTVPTGVWEHKGGAVGFDEAAWIQTLSRTERIDGMIAKNAAVLDRNDPEKKIGFAVDEWGTWYDDGPAPAGGVLYQQNTLRDGLVAALNLNIFHAHADRVHMTSIAQMVDVLQAMVLTDDARMVLTPTYHVFRMYVPFQDATALPATLTGVPEYALGATHIPALSVSAARGKDGLVHLALVNTDPHHAITIALRTAGLSISGVRGEALGASQLDAHNTFDAPDAVHPQPWQAALDGHGGATLTVPPASVVVCAVTASAAP